MRIEESYDGEHKFFIFASHRVGKFYDNIELKSYLIQHMRIAVSGVNVSL